MAGGGSMLPLTDAARVSSGRGHVCILMLDGTVQCGGVNDEGQLGALPDDSPFPREVPGVRDVVQLVAADDLNMVLRADGTVQWWGLAVSSGTFQRSAIPVDLMGIGSAQYIASSGGTSCAALADGTVWCWGTLGLGTSESNRRVALEPEQVPEIDTAVAVAVGSGHQCALLADGRVQCWGDNDRLELGREGPNSEIPSNVMGIADAVAISSGGGYTCAQRVNGSVWCWGANLLGIGGNDDETLPFEIQGLPPVMAVATGGRHICVVAEGGAAWCWGDGGTGGLGNGSQGFRFGTTPSEVVGLRDAVAISAGNAHGCAVLTDTTVKCWGAGRTFSVITSPIDAAGRYSLPHLLPLTVRCCP